MLIVGNIPNPNEYLKSETCLDNYAYLNGTHLQAWNYSTIDGDGYAAYPAVKNGHFYLDGGDYTTMDRRIISQAFQNAREKRFEYEVKTISKKQYILARTTAEYVNDKLRKGDWELVSMLVRALKEERGI